MLDRFQGEVLFIEGVNVRSLSVTKAHACLSSLVSPRQALFGDVQTHRTSVLPQAESYVHRFGPGIVLYWFGHAPLQRLGDAQGDVIVIGWDVPAKFMLPTGQIVSSPEK